VFTVPDQVPLEEGKNFRVKQQNCLLREENKGEKAQKKRREVQGQELLAKEKIICFMKCKVVCS